MVALNTGGLPDIVEHQRTGYLAKAFDTQDLARGIVLVLHLGEFGQTRARARQQAVSRLDAAVVADLSVPVYRGDVGLRVLRGAKELDDVHQPSSQTPQGPKEAIYQARVYQWLTAFEASAASWAMDGQGKIDAD